MAVDPVCGMKVDERSSKFAYTYQGVTYYFCRQQCLDQFRRDPVKYLKR